MARRHASITPSQLVEIALVSGKGAYDYPYRRGVMRHPRTGTYYLVDCGFRWFSPQTGGYGETCYQVPPEIANQVQMVVERVATDPFTTVSDVQQAIRDAISDPIPPVKEK